jgi:hypothetical protein
LFDRPSGLSSPEGGVAGRGGRHSLRFVVTGGHAAQATHCRRTNAGGRSARERHRRSAITVCGRSSSFVPVPSRRSFLASTRAPPPARCTSPAPPPVPHQSAAWHPIRQVWLSPRDGLRF